MKLWIDDVRPAPEGYVWCKSVYTAITEIAKHSNEIELIDIDHDAGEYTRYGGDYIVVLEFLEYNGFSCSIRIHSMNPVGVANMRRIIQRNGWKEVF